MKNIPHEEAAPENVENMVGLYNCEQSPMHGSQDYAELVDVIFDVNIPDSTQDNTKN